MEGPASQRRRVTSSPSAHTRRRARANQKAAGEQLGEDEAGGERGLLIGSRGAVEQDALGAALAHQLAVLPHLRLVAGAVALAAVGGVRHGGAAVQHQRSAHVTQPPGVTCRRGQVSSARCRRDR
ncbi:hypothetical protein EYF80_065813 [Liparis tanakae]|uniref:Uncharacterized protein n=1 Tax=Liparis tanakae TaxID=230148 RepID=A0A4Z2E5Y8_9TELE|nr:hypothetical protein EYF80_065813 [Liparis tanakae]